ncbi:hypothetical protein HDU98_000151 [Podochytrium sp. JEL0797]|nr:hypothetical protein HDU98_000151 [Podochytrium sp. JEL0797]
MALWRRCKVSWQWMLYLMAALLGICLYVFINTTQSLILTNILRIPTDQLGDKSGNLTFADQIASLFAVYIFGLSSDFVGRRCIYGFGFSTMGIALCLYPRVESYTALMVVRLVFALGGGAATSMLTAVLADYANDEVRGRMAGLVGLFAGCGALVALFVFMPLPFKFDSIVKGLQTTYLIVGLIACTFGVLLFFFLTPNSTHPSETPLSAVQAEGDLLPRSGVSTDSAAVLIATESSSSKNIPNPHSSTIAMEGSASSCPVMGSRSSPLSEESPATVSESPEPIIKKSVMQVAKEGLLAAKDPKIMLGYVGSFLARGDTVIITLFIPLWVYRVYIDRGLCEAPGGPEDPDIKDACADAYSRAMMISGIAQTFALIGAPIFGYLADRFHATNVVLFTAMMGLCSYGSMFFADPLVNSVLAIVAFMGLSEIGLIVGNMSLVTSSKSVDKSVRGSVAGISSACGAIGILISSKLGGYLFDNWKEGAPFLILAVGHLIAVLAGVYVFVHEWRQRRAMGPVL